MNKKIKEILLPYDMKIDEDYAYGKIEGFETNIKTKSLNSFTPFLMHISFFHTEEQKSNITLKFISSELATFKFKFTSYGMFVIFNKQSLKKNLANLTTIINFIFDTLKENSIKGADFCPVCGEEMDSNNLSVVQVNNFKIIVKKEYSDALASDLKKQITFYDPPNNYWKGFLGALIGGIIGFVISIILNLVGYFSTFSGLFAVVIGTALYQKFGGRPGKAMILIVGLTSVICLILSVFAVWITASAIAVREYGLVMPAIDAFKMLMSDAQFADSFYSDLLLSITFAGGGVLVESLFTYKKLKQLSKTKF